MNTVLPALPSANGVAGMKPVRQPPAQSNAAASWDATYSDAREAAHSDSGSRPPEPASGEVTAEGTDGKPAKTVSAPGQPGNAQSHSALGSVTARQGTPIVKDDRSAVSGQSDGGRGIITAPSSDGNGTPVGDPTAGTIDSPSARAAAPGDPTVAGQSTDTDQPTVTSTVVSLDQPTNGVTRTTIGKTSKSPGKLDGIRTDHQQDGTDRAAESANAADPSADSSVASDAVPPAQPDTPIQLRTDKIASRAAQTKHVPPDVASSNVSSASANAQVVLSQSALPANAPIGTDRAKKSDDSDSIILAAGATSGAVAPPLPPPQPVNGAAGAQGPEPAAQELLHHTTTNLVTDGGGTARIVLTPPTLGHVEVRVTMAASGAAHIAITAATADGYAALSASHAGLLQHLAQRGVSVGSVQTQLQGNAGQNGGTSNNDGRQRHNQPTPAVPWVRKGQDGTVIAYA